MKKLSFDSIKNIGGTNYFMDEDGQWKSLDESIAYQSYQDDVRSKLQTYLNIYKDGCTGGQCEQFTDNFVEAITGIRMEGANG